MNNLLVEMLVEELPPKALESLGDAFARVLTRSLSDQGLLAESASFTVYASPRRLAVHIRDVAERAADKAQAQKLMPVSVGLDSSGKPTAALLKKLQALGSPDANVSELRRAMDGKAESLFLDSTSKGVDLADGLQEALRESIARLPIPKVMTYQLESDCELPGWSSVSFVRPAHGLVALHGSAVVPVQALGLRSGRTTLGHRFESKVDVVEFRHADEYAEKLEREGSVVASFSQRRAEIERQIAQACASVGGGAQVVPDSALLDEVTALVEHPTVYVAQFEPEFLAVPQECLILTMKANQKYFPLLDADGRLLKRFLVVSNMHVADPHNIVSGNERVVRARLSDARFFFEQDKKTPLAGRITKMESVVYHNRLGSQFDRVMRIQRLSAEIAGRLDADVLQAARAGLLAKADLATDMVGEFPELQGVMGRYYAQHDGESDVVAAAVEQHYRPRFAGDALPQGAVACAVSLADKIDALVGFFGIGQIILQFGCAQSLSLHFLIHGLGF